MAMKLTEKFTYAGGPLDGQTALPTSRRGPRYTQYRTADGAPLRTYYGNRWGGCYSSEATPRTTHPGFYCRRPGTNPIHRDENGQLVYPGEYRWHPPPAPQNTPNHQETP